MGYIQKPFEDLSLMDDFLSTSVAADEEVGEQFCRAVLTVLLQRKIGKIRITAQRTIPASTPKLRGIRMDVEIREFGEEPETEVQLPVKNIYDLEPHHQNNINLERHNRFYQAKIDNRYVLSGEKTFAKMPNLYVLTITDYDPFGYDYMMYRIRNRCDQVLELDYEDGLEFLYFYTDGSKGGTPEIREMLQYFKNSREENAINETTKKVHDYVSRVKVMPEVKQEYMVLEEYIWCIKQEAAEEAAKEANKELSIQHILDLLEDYGSIPEVLKEHLEAEEDIETLNKWHKMAARAESISEFMAQIGME